MKKLKNFYWGICFLTTFVLWTVLVRCVDVSAIGPNGSSVGFATINKFTHNITGVHISLYTITDWLGLVPFAVAGGFAVLGISQWIKRGRLNKVDRDIFVLGGFYAITVVVYLFFEKCIINYRPILIGGYLEASYPSSTTLLTMCVMPTAVAQFKLRIKNCLFKKIAVVAAVVFTVFMVVGRLVSGVHWLSDIIGGALLSAGLVYTYLFVCNRCSLKT